jgi:hypothetical protein
VLLGLLDFVDVDLQVSRWWVELWVVQAFNKKAWLASKGDVQVKHKAEEY